MGPHHRRPKRSEAALAPIAAANRRRRPQTVGPRCASASSRWGLTAGGRSAARLRLHPLQHGTGGGDRRLSPPEAEAQRGCACTHCGIEPPAATAVCRASLRFGLFAMGPHRRRPKRSEAALAPIAASNRRRRPQSVGPRCASASSRWGLTAGGRSAARLRLHPLRHRTAGGDRSLSGLAALRPPPIVIAFPRSGAWERGISRAIPSDRNPVAAATCKHFCILI